MLVDLCIRWEDKVNADPFEDWGCSKQGDVIEILPAGSDFGSDIHNDSRWRIVRLDIPSTLIEALLTPETEAVLTRTNLKRKYHVNLATLPNNVRNQIDRSLGGVADYSAFDITPYVELKTVP